MDVKYPELANPEGLGVEIIEGFVSETELEAIYDETQDPEKVDWIDVHSVYTNKRGLTIEQNHYAFALKLSAGDQSPLGRIPETVGLYKRTQDFITSLSSIFPNLAGWEADELSFHLYDDKEVGLSRHRDNPQFYGLIAILAIDGECDLVITEEDEENHAIEESALHVCPGDLTLLRGPGLIDVGPDFEVRPEHSVQNLGSDTRLSMMLRANSRPEKKIEGFHFNNWMVGE